MSAAGPPIRIVILNYNGAELLERCLPSVAEAVSRAQVPAAVTVLDNGSTDASLEFVAKHFPDIEIARSPANRVLCSYNEYLPKVSEPVAILLNNDIRVEPGFIDPLAEIFARDPLAFLAAPRVMTFDGARVEAARAKAGLRWGLFWCDARYPGYEREAHRASETFSSGFGAFSREKFLALGGYDAMYLPGIMEDVDLCYRARRAGWNLYYEPRSVVFHMGQATFRKTLGPSRLAVLAHRNNFLFMWKNLKGISFWLRHLFFLPLRLAFAAAKGNGALVRGFWEALRVKVSR